MNWLSYLGKENDEMWNVKYTLPKKSSAPPMWWCSWSKMHPNPENMDIK